MKSGTPKLLIVDDDSLVVEFLEETLRNEGYSLRSAHSGEAALEELKRDPAQLVLSDIKMGGMDGITLLSKIKETAPETVVVMMTAFGTVDTAVLAMKLGAFDFIMKPMSPDVVKVRLKKALEHVQLAREVKTLRLDTVKRYRDIIGKSKQMREVFETISAAAPSRATVLITGESGTGKELVARAIHQESDRSDGPFVKLNCAALNQNLIESELFGHEKGAFTGALQARTGRFELANGGTLLLDEISEMPIETQAKLLRVLQEKELERVGSAESVDIDVRIIASSNRDLPEAISSGVFREDLYYRLNVIPLKLPSLRGRMDDLPLLIDYFVNKYSEENGREPKRVDEEGYQSLMKHSWPGNVRELENTIQAAVVMSRGETLRSEDFNLSKSSISPSTSRKLQFERMTLYDLERQIIMDRLDQCAGNKADAARSLDVSPRTIRNKLKQYRVDDGLLDPAEDLADESELEKMETVDES